MDKQNKDNFKDRILKMVKASVDTQGWVVVGICTIFFIDIWK